MADAAQVEGTQRKPSLGAVFLQLGLALLAGVGSFECNACSKHSDAPKEASGTPQIKAVMHLDSFVVNLADPEESRFLRVGIDLGLESPLAAKGGRGEETEVPTARVRDTILGVLSTWRSDALLAPDGKQKLKEELVRVLRGRVPELGVREVYFTDFLVQR
jgi:flagellar FliL protein